MSAPRRRCPNCGVLTYGTHTFAECIEALREALMASEDDAKDAHDAAVAAARAQGAAEAFEKAAKRVDGRAGADSYADDNRPCPACCELNAAAIRALAREAAK